MTTSATDRGEGKTTYVVDLLRRTLAVPVVYRMFARVMGGPRGRDMFARDHIRAREGQRILDIGCGPADMLAHLPRVDYAGFDANASYIQTAQKNYGDRGRFYCQTVSAEALGSHADFDIVLALNVLHHLDNIEAAHLFALAKGALKPGGRLVTSDCVYVPGQSRIARFLISRDRGQHVRDERGYVAIAESAFTSNNVKAIVREDMMRIPYTHLVLECERARNDKN